MSHDPSAFAVRPTALSPITGKHERIFTALLVALGLFCVIAIGEFIFILNAVKSDSPWVFKYVIFVQSVFLVAIIATIILRALLPSYRRVITMSLSIFLLLYFPIGTAIGIYGLMKVDKGPALSS